MKRTKKTAVTLLCVCIMLVVSTLSVAAAPRYTYISRNATNITQMDYGFSAYSSVLSTSSAPVKMTVTCSILQSSNMSSWIPVASRQETYNPAEGDHLVTAIYDRAINGYYYCARSTVVITDQNGRELERSTIDSRILQAVRTYDSQGNLQMDYIEVNV